MAEWIGQTLAGVPEWLFLPLLIIVIGVAVVWAWMDAVSYNLDWPFKSSRIDSGDKKNDKK